MKSQQTIVLVTLGSCVLAGCAPVGKTSIYSYETQQILKKNPTFKNYVGPILNDVPHHTSISHFTLQYTRTVNSFSRLSFYTYMWHGSLYQGLVLMNKQNGRWIEEFGSRRSRVFPNVAFTQTEMSGGGGKQEPYFAVGGIINNASIRAINIYLVNGTLAQVPISPHQKTYFFVNTGSQQGVMKIAGVNNHGVPVYQYH